MICNNCGKKQAVYTRTEIINGEVRTINLCEDCLSSFNIPQNIFNYSEMLQPFFHSFSLPKLQERTCPSCGMKLSQIKNSAYLGCSNCYEVFRDFIIPAVRCIHPSDRHVGRAPLGSAPPKEVKTSGSLTKLQQLEQDLKKAVSEERYLDASKIKIEIQNLKGENHNG